MTAKRYILHKPEHVSNCIQFISEHVPLPGDKSPKGGTYRRPYRVVIEPHIEDMNTEQRGGFHWLCGILGNELGYRLGEIKEMVKERVWGSDQVIGPDGRHYKITRSSERDESGKKTNKVDYGALIEGVYELAGEAGVVLPALDKYRKGEASNP